MFKIRGTEMLKPLICVNSLHRRIVNLQRLSSVINTDHYRDGYVVFRMKDGTTVKEHLYNYADKVKHIPVYSIADIENMSIDDRSVTDPLSLGEVLMIVDANNNVVVDFLSCDDLSGFNE